MTTTATEKSQCLVLFMHVCQVHIGVTLFNSCSCYWLLPLLPLIILFSLRKCWRVLQSAVSLCTSENSPIRKLPYIIIIMMIAQPKLTIAQYCSFCSFQTQFSLFLFVG